MRMLLDIAIGVLAIVDEEVVYIKFGHSTATVTFVRCAHRRVRAAHLGVGVGGPPRTNYR